MRLRYHTEQLAHILRDFHNLTGLSISVVDADLNHLIHYPDPLNRFCQIIQSSPEGARRCNRSDNTLLCRCRRTGLPSTHRCHAGLTDTAVPIRKDDVLLGFIMFGQISEKNENKIPFEQIEANIADLGLDRDELKKTYEELMLFDRQRIESAAEIVSMLTKYICLEHMIQPQYNKEFEELLEYIEKHLTDRLTVSFLCSRFHFSKNTLYRYFRTNFNCTVSDYVNRLRMKRAETLLVTTDLPIYVVCEQAGIDNYQYFCRRFKKEKGLSPLQYRKNNTPKKD